MTEGAFSDVKILDLTWYISGPYCTKLFADFGADVIKVEKPGEGDPARRMGPFLNDEPHPEKSTLFCHLNTNKRGITLNLKSAAGKKIFKELVKEVDILAESFSPGVMERLGLDYKVLRQINPKLVMTSISNFGQTGPYRNFKLSELVLNGLGHEMYECRHPDRHPLKMGGNVTQYQGGLVASLATLGALWARDEQGFGQYVDVSLQETQAGDIDRKTINLVSWAYTGDVTYPRIDPSTSARTVMPSGVFPCQDGFIQSLPVLPHWPRFLALMKTPELERFNYPNDLLNMDLKGEIDAIWYPWCTERSKRQAMEECQAVKFFVTAIQTPKDAVEDPHFNERGVWVEIEHPVTGKQIYPGAPIRMGEAPWQVRMPAPTLGQHNIEVYCDLLGYTRADLVRLRETGVI